MVKIVLHEDYSYYGTINDISLLKLASPFEFNDYVNAIPIPVGSLAGERSPQEEAHRTSCRRLTSPSCRTRSAGRPTVKRPSRTP